MRPLVTTVRCLIVDSLRLNRDPETIDPDADLFASDLGLDSVDAVQLVTSIEKHFDIHVSDRDLAQHPFTSVQSIVRLLEARSVTPQACDETGHDLPK